MQSETEGEYKWIFHYVDNLTKLCATMVNTGSNLCGLTPKIFWLIPSYVSEIRLFLEKAFKYFLSLQSYSTQQALQNLNFVWPFFQKVHFIGKDSFVIYLYNGIIETFVAHLGAVLWQLLWRVSFGGFWTPWHSWIRESCKIRQKYHCTVTVIAQRPDELQRFPRCHCKDKWQSYIFFKTYFLII